MEKILAWIALAVITGTAIIAALTVPGLLPGVLKDNAKKLERYGRVLLLVSLFGGACIAAVTAKMLVKGYVTNMDVAVLFACLAVELYCIMSHRKTDELLMHLQMIESEVKRNEKK